MTNNEAAKWIQLYIDLAKIDPTTGEAAYLNDDDKKTIEAMEMAINALTAQPEERTETHARDLIDRQALMKEFSDFVRASNNSDFAPTPTWNDVVSLVGSMQPAQPEQRWIPCSEGTPKKTGYYICTCHDGVCYRTSALKWSTGWVLTGARSYWKVIAWMPLPKPFVERWKE